MRSLFIAVLLGACTGTSPSDDPARWDVDTSAAYRIEVGEPRWVVPSDGLPPEVTPQPSNNNVEIHFFDGRLFMAWRTGPTHFASVDTTLWVVSSRDGGDTWDFEAEIALGTDVREPRFLSMNGELQLLYFEGGMDPLAFEPVAIWRTWRSGRGRWSEPEYHTTDPEVPWDVKERDGLGWMTSYAGEHYGGADAVVEVYFKQSTNGRAWEKVDSTHAVYTGGVSEAAFEFDSDGSLWVVTRNEDGDASGWGSHVCWAPADDLSAWECPSTSDPERYDSPELFRHGDDIYLVARRDIGGPFQSSEDSDLLGDLLSYSLRPKTTALYRIDKESRSVVHLTDLPGAGDTAFPSVRRTGAHSFLVANYTSPLDEPELSWLAGQTSERGTQLYLLELTFVPEAP